MGAACQRLLANSFLKMLKILFMVKANKSHVLGNQSATLTQELNKNWEVTHLLTHK